MAKLAESLMGVGDIGKVRNRKVAKSRILLLILINSVGTTLLLGLPPKQDGRPIGYITLRTLIPSPKRRLSHLWRLICGLLRMAKLVEPLMGVGNIGKVPNRKVAKSHFVVLVLVLNKTIGKA